MGSEVELSNTNTKSSLTSGHRCWTRHSDEALHNVEKNILSCVKTPYKSYYVNIGPVVGKSDKIWTISLNEESDRVPLVLLHGMGAGLALWCPNLDALAASRPVYALDLLGFGRSSRPRFATEAPRAEAQWVESVEEWRRELNLPQFVLLGHSLGGYIATAYAIKYPERVRHLIVADPWGYNERTPEDDERYRKIPFWKRAIVTSMKPFNPMFAVRAAGPAGKWLVTKTRPDIPRKYVKYLPDAETTIPEYIYQCNSQTPSGESAFHTLGEGFVFAKNPMVNRLEQIHPSVPISYLYGSRSWLPCCSELVLQKRPSSKVYIKMIEDASHHIYLDNPELFNSAVLESCARADEYDPQIIGGKESNGHADVAGVDQPQQIGTSTPEQPSLPFANHQENSVAIVY